MLLALSVVSEQGTALGNAAYKIFDERGGSIGRVAGNDWVLPDPQNFVSSRHARVSANAGVFFLEDTSSNGTFINAPDRLAPRTEPHRLTDGDRIYIGDYEIIVQLIPSAPAEIAARAPAPPMSDAPTRLQAPAPARAPAPVAPPMAHAAPEAQAVQAAPPIAHAAQAAPPMPPPSALGLGTVDPLAALGSASSAADPLAALGATPSSRNPAPAAPNPHAERSSARGTSDPLAALDSVTSGPLAALGIDASRLDPDLQAALLVALRTGFNALLTRLHPQHLEELYERKSKLTAVLGLGNKARYWEMYRAHFEEIDGDRETHFRQLFGADFAAAFNDQLQKLADAARLRGPR